MKKPTKEKTSELERQIKELKEGWQRTQADFENYKSRTAQEKALWTRDGKIEVLGEILPLLDNLNLAASHTPKELADNSWAQGINHIAKQIDAVLEELGIKKVHPRTGDEFNPELHEAIESRAHPQVPDGAIITTTLAGYLVEGVLTRPAKVVVSKQKEHEEKEGNGNA